MPLDINDPDVKAAIEAAVDDAVSGLKAKNIDLAARLEKARKGREIDPDEHSQLEVRNAELETQLAAATKANKTATIELDKFKKAHESESNFTRQLLVDNGLVDALTKAGVTNPTSLKAAKAMLKDGVSLVVDGDVRKAMLGDKDLGEAITEWAGSDEGKHFVAAPVNSGSDSKGSGKPASADVMKLSPVQRMELGRKQA